MADQACGPLAQRVLALAEEAECRICVAESCTGGLLGGALTAIPGSSRAFAGGVIAYSNEAKHQALGVRQATIEKYGAVSRACVLEMSTAAARLFNVEIGVAISGVAGPTGGTAEKPVGTVWLAVSSGQSGSAFHYVFPGDRLEVRNLSVEAALQRLIEKLELG